MNNFTQRTLSAAVYAGVVISSILVHPDYFGIVFFLLTILAVREYAHLMKMPVVQQVICSVLGGILFAITWHTLLCGQFCESVVMGLLIGYFMLLLTSLILELFLKAENPIHQWGYILQSQWMIALPFALMNVVMAQGKYWLLALFITIWINDSGAYIVGSLMGKRKSGNHKMFPRVSPGKSWEGLIGGMIFALISGFVFYKVHWIDSLSVALLFALLISIFGTLGDLMESLMKRTIGIKDSGKFMPGHGGVLDRFDSLLLATPVVVLLLICLA